MEQENLKSLSVYSGMVNQNEELESEYRILFQEFDRNGKLITEITWADEDTLETKILYKYDDQTRLAEEINYYSEDEVCEHKRFYYLPDGELQRAEIEYADGSVSLQEFEYQPSKRVIIYKDEDGELESREERIFNEKGLLVEFIRFSGDNDTELKVVNAFDERDLLTLRQEFNYKEDIASETRYQYDESGNQIAEQTISNRGNIMDTRAMKYDERGNMVEELINDYTIRYTYDEKDRRMEREVTDPAGRVESYYQYSYDDNDLLLEEKIYNVNRRSSMAVMKGAYILRRYEYAKY
jgi:YD repeat-containing protein